MKKKNITCTTCPVGCQLIVEGTENEILNISGNLCKRGEFYAKDEYFLPKRILTTSIKVNDGEYPLVSVRSKEPLAKDKIFNYMNIIQKVVVKSPVNRGDVLISNIGNSGIDIIATANVKKRN